MSTSEFHTRWCEIHWYPMIISKIRRLASKHVTDTHHLLLGQFDLHLPPLAGTYRELHRYQSIFGYHFIALDFTLSHKLLAPICV